MPRNKPLTAEHERLINEYLQRLADLQMPLEKMERCGLDCQEMEAARTQMIEMLQNIKREFFQPAASNRG